MTGLFLLTDLVFTQTKPGNGDAEFTAFLAKLDAAQVELQNGKAEAFKAGQESRRQVRIRCPA